MEATVERIDGDKNKVTATVPASVVESNLKKVYRELANKYNFPGFRKGKAPRKVIDSALGAEFALAQATEDVVNDAYPIIIEEQGLFPVGDPKFDEFDPVVPGADFTFTFTVGAKPEIELSSYDALEIEMPPQEVTEDEINEELDYMTRHYEVYTEAPDDVALDADNYASLNVVATTSDGEEVSLLTGEDQFFTPEGGLFSTEFENKIFGMKKGDVLEFSLDVKEDEDAILMGDVLGKTVNFKVTCISVQQKTRPDMTDEWVRENLHFESLEDLRKEISDSIQAQKDEIMPHIKENACKMALVERVTDDIPDNLVESAESELLQDFFTQLQQQNITFDSYLASRGIDNEQFKQDVKLQAMDEAKEQVALDAWARKKEISINESDVLQEFEDAGVDDPKKTLETWRASGRLYLIREGIMRQRAMDDAMEGAVVTIVDRRKESEEDKKAQEEE